MMSPVGASHEYPVYRMHQFDLHGVSRGCRVSSINLEARSLTTWSTQRHCVVSRLTNLTALHLYKIKEGAGGLLIMLPKHLNTLNDDEKEVLHAFEHQYLGEEIHIPVYFASYSPELEAIVSDIESNKILEIQKSTAWDAILNSLSANGYQIVITASRPSVKTDAQILSMQGKLIGYGVQDKLPTIIIVAHYDSFGVSPDLSYGADSNASGVIMLLELIRIFSHLYTNSWSHARFNIMFLLSGGGKINYQGSKKWLEDQLEGAEGSAIHDAQYVICLDTVSSKTLYFHVSKPPREGTPLFRFYKEFSKVTSVPVELIHKKINLADEILAWEHERFSIRRLPASTISSFRSYKDPERGTIYDVSDTVDTKSLAHNIGYVATALIRQMYNISGPPATLSSYLSADEDMIKTWLEFLTSRPRSASLIYEKNNPLIKGLHEYMNRYLDDVKISSQVADKRDPEFVFYDATKSTVHIYSVKPAIFDLFLTLLITLYLTVIYLIIQNFGHLYGVFVPSRKVKTP